MADLPVSPIRLLASLRKLSKRFLVAEEELRIARDSWDDANLSTMESESAGSELPGVLAADEDRLEAALMQLSYQFFEIEDTIDSVARDLAFVMPWPIDKIAEAIRRLETKIGLRPHRFTDGRTLADLQEFPCLVLAIDKGDWPSLAGLAIYEKSLDGIADKAPVDCDMNSREMGGPPRKKRAKGLAVSAETKRDVADKALKAVVSGLGLQKSIQLSAHLLLADVCRKAGTKISKRTLERTPTYLALIAKGNRKRRRIPVQSAVLDQLVDEESSNAHGLRHHVPRRVAQD